MHDLSLKVPISPTLAVLARRFGIDLASIADAALTDRVVGEAVGQLTARMHTALLRAKELAATYGHSHIGCEHVMLAILLDKDAVPTQAADRLDARDALIEQLETLLQSPGYNQRAGQNGGY